MPDAENTDGRKRRSKIERIASKYDMPGIETELAESWLGEQVEQRSLRQLSEYMNQQLLRTAMQKAGMDPLDGEVENMYGLLVEDEATTGMRTQAEETLRQHDIDVEQLRKDFVSHQTIYTYLTEQQNLSKDDSQDRDQTGKAIKSIQRLNNRMVAVSKNTLKNLRSTGRITLGKFNVIVDVHVYCYDCEKQYTIVELLKSGGCSCEIK